MHLFDVFVNKTETAYSDELYVCQFQQVQHQISTCLHDFQSWSLFPCHHLNLQRGCGISVVVRVAVTYICIITIEFQCERSSSLVTKEVTYSIEFIALARASFSQVSKISFLRQQCLQIMQTIMSIRISVLEMNINHLENMETYKALVHFSK